MIRNSARGAFFEKGYQKINITQIAKDSDVSVNTVYWYFSGKYELFVVVFDETVKLFLDTVAIRSKDYTLSDNLR